MKTIFQIMFIIVAFFLMPWNIFSQDFKITNRQVYKALDTISNIKLKKIIDKKHLNGNPKEIGVFVKKIIENKKIYNYVGYHIKYYANGSVKDSGYFDINSNFIGIGKGYYRDGKIKWIALSRNISIEEGLKYSKNRTGLCDSYEIYFYKNGNKKLEFGTNLKKASNWFGTMTICSISYNEDGSIKSSVILDE